jgi:hypothetical protein
VLTALHVVADRKTKAPQFLAGRIRLRFPGRDDIYATPLDEMWDSDLDWILLRCDKSPGAKAIALAKIRTDGLEWETFGFPDTNPIDGMVHRGSVENVAATLMHVPALQLWSKQSASGTGDPANGLSGAPILVGNVAVGHLRFALGSGKVAAGTLYGCPISAVAECCDFIEVRELQIPDKQEARITLQLGTGFARLHYRTEIDGLMVFTLKPLSGGSMSLPSLLSTQKPLRPAICLSTPRLATANRR